MAPLKVFGRLMSEALAKRILADRRVRSMPKRLRGSKNSGSGKPKGDLGPSAG